MFVSLCSPKVWDDFSSLCTFSLKLCWPLMLDHSVKGKHTSMWTEVKYLSSRGFRQLGQCMKTCHNKDSPPPPHKSSSYMHASQKESMLLISCRFALPRSNMTCIGVLISLNMHTCKQVGMHPSEREGAKFCHLVGFADLHRTSHQFEPARTYTSRNASMWTRGPNFVI